MWEFSQIRADRRELIEWLPSLADIWRSGILPAYGNSYFWLNLSPREAYSNENDFQERLLDTIEWLKSIPKYHKWAIFTQSDVVEFLNAENSELRKSIFEEIDVVDIIEALDSNVSKFRELGIEIEDSADSINMDAWYADDFQSRHRLYDLRVRQDFILHINKETRERVKSEIDRIMNTDVSTLINKK